MMTKQTDTISAWAYRYGDDYRSPNLLRYFQDTRPLREKAHKEGYFTKAEDHHHAQQIQHSQHPKKEEAYHSLVTRNLSFALKKAKDFYQRGNKKIELDDLVQIANLGLMEAALGFTPETDPKHDVKFITWAGKVISNKLQKAFYEQSRLIRINEPKQKEFFLVLDTEKKLQNILYRKPTSQEVANELGMTEKKVDKLKQQYQDSISENTPIKQGAESLQLIDTYAIKDQLDAFQAIYIEQSRTLIEGLMKMVNTKGRKNIDHSDIILRYYGIGIPEEETVETLAAEYTDGNTKEIYASLDGSMRILKSHADNIIIRDLQSEWVGSTNTKVQSEDQSTDIVASIKEWIQTEERTGTNKDKLISGITSKTQQQFIILCLQDNANIKDISKVIGKDLHMANRLGSAALKNLKKQKNNASLIQSIKEIHDQAATQGVSWDSLTSGIRAENQRKFVALCVTGSTNMISIAEELQLDSYLTKRTGAAALKNLKKNLDPVENLPPPFKLSA